MSTRTGEANIDPIMSPYLEQTACGMISPAGVWHIMANIITLARLQSFVMDSAQQAPKHAQVGPADVLMHLYLSPPPQQSHAPKSNTAVTLMTMAIDSCTM
eukprot:365630-Chlamydomonas_euryale.AAC.25